MKIFWTLRQLPEVQSLSPDTVRDMKRRGVLHSLFMGRALVIVMLCLPNVVAAHISFTARPQFWALPLLVSILLSIAAFLVFNHRELVRDREKIRRYLENLEREHTPQKP